MAKDRAEWVEAHLVHHLGPVVADRHLWSPAMKFYAGIGSRQTPDRTLQLMEKLAMRLREGGWTLRSGGANGADSAFERGAGQQAQIFVPWRGFNGNPSRWVIESEGYAKIAAHHHPNWGACNDRARKLHIRNVAQVLGPPTAPTHSTFVVCWTPDGKGGGGTGQAIRIAKTFKVPVFDLFHGVGPLAEFMKTVVPVESIDAVKPIEVLESDIPY